MTLQKAIEDRESRFVGVLRVGLSTQTLDDIAALHVNEADANDPHRIFISDQNGRLVTRLRDDDRLELFGGDDGDLRFVPRDMPAQIERALQDPLLQRAYDTATEASGSFVASGESYIVTYRALERTQDWVVGIVVPEEYYTRDLRAFRARFLLAYLIVTALVFLVGGLAVRALGRSLGRIAGMTARMRDFDFAASDERAPFRDVKEVMDGLERAKTVVRALGKYLPLTLVRELYQSNREPVLGGELLDVSIMFTDIEAFTNLSERLAPDALARALGSYLKAMTSSIEGRSGTIDKFIGDAVMAIWNAPSPCAEHPKRACEAALACVAANRALYVSPEWAGLPPLVTRFGLHHGKVLVGHFGAPTRMSYTALGDGVNLAARLESLCKQYGVVILVSEAIEVEVRKDFIFRLVDVVAVKGKKQAVKVYELLGAAGETIATLGTARRYEEAFAAYARRDFAGAITILAAQTHDPPSAVLLARCEHLSEQPPPDDWDGVFIASSK